MFDGTLQADSTALTHLDAVERALVAGDVPEALHRLRRARRSMLPAKPEQRGCGREASPIVCALTEREVATLRLLPDARLTQKDMARALGVSRNTVKTHLKSIYQKLEAHSRAEAIDAARRLGILESAPSSGLLALRWDAGERDLELV